MIRPPSAHGLVELDPAMIVREKHVLYDVIPIRRQIAFLRQECSFDRPLQTRGHATGDVGWDGWIALVR
jgi:hypothetical protein